MGLILEACVPYWYDMIMIICFGSSNMTIQYYWHDTIVTISIVILLRILLKGRCESLIDKQFFSAVSAAVDIGLSNWSFMYITVSMYTMCKSTTIIFILISAIIFKLEKPVSGNFEPYNLNI